jgi:putative addiction module component (TIGR02574 family)
MTSIVDEITLKARSLPAEDRARLAEDLLSSLQEDGDPAIEAAWDTEIRRRLDEVEAGTAKLIPAAEVFAEVRRMLK